MGRGNCDLRYELEAVNPRKRERNEMEAVKGKREQLAAGYATLDQASTEPYSDKERRGLDRAIIYPTRD